MSTEKLFDLLNKMIIIFMMTKNKKIILIIVFAVGIPIVYGVTYIIRYFAPTDLSKDELTLWVARWSGSLAIVIVIFILAFLYRFWLSKK